MTKTNSPESLKERPLRTELFWIKPIMLGGDPADPSNKILLTREQHLEAVRYWNNIIFLLRRGR
jgi:hypothetical protein